MATTSTKLQTFQKVMNEVYGTGEKPKPYTDNKGRYLWTDAFGVCNYITLFYETGNAQFLDRADALIRDVHDVLGKDRKGLKRLGNATDDHPTRCGLRIGKVEEEGAEDGDGQYFHYLTKWAFALSKMSAARGNRIYNDWAIELIQGIHDRFVYNQSSQQPHMHWKMSIDLSRPLVRSEGNLDPFDGFVTYREIQQQAGVSTVLQNEIAVMEKMVNAKYRNYNSNDPLDLGEALWIAHFFPTEEWSKVVTQRSLQSLEYLYQRQYFSPENRYRLAFREFGTTIGVQVNSFAPPQWKERVELLHSYWEPKLYKRDQDITPVMFCTSLIPGVFWKLYPKTQEKQHVAAST